MTRTLAALTTAATLAFSGAAFAQTTVIEVEPSTGAGYDMLTTSLMGDLDRLDIDISPEDMDALTLGQLAAIKQVIESEDNDTQTKGQIEAIIANN